MNTAAKKNTPLSHGQRLKRLRREKKMTLQALAEKAELSASFISLIERNKTVPSILSLYSLANALGVDIEYFFKPPKTNDIYHSGKNPEHVEIDSPISYVHLSASHPEQQMDAYIFGIPPGPILPQQEHNGECFYYQLEGILHFKIGDEEFEVQPGDSMHFNSEHGFTVQNRGKKEARVLWVGTPILFPQKVDKAKDL